MQAIPKAPMRLLALAAIFGLGVAAPSTSAVACVEGDMRGEVVVAERKFGATAPGEDASIQILGAGWFRAAEVIKQGGSSDRTFVTIELDGAEMIATSFAALKSPWMQIETPLIVAKVRTQGDTRILTIWYQPELKFQAIAVLRVDVQESGVDGLQVRTTMNKPYPHTHLPGQQPTALALPAFK